MLSIKHNTRTDSSDKQSLDKFQAGPVEYVESRRAMSTIHMHWKSLRCVMVRFENNNNGASAVATQNETASLDVGHRLSAEDAADRMATG
ncbi:unnamed protein product, partial [Iphiclides podalirius]